MIREITENNGMRDDLGITLADSQGHNGEDVVWVVYHGVPEIADDIKDCVYVPYPEFYHAYPGSDHTVHDTKVLRGFLSLAQDMLHDVCKIKVAVFPIENEEVLVNYEIPWIKENRACLGWVSASSQHPLNYDKYFEPVKDFFTFIASEGNDGLSGYNKMTDSLYVVGCGAVEFNRRSGTYDIAFYTSRSDTVDIGSPANFFIPATGNNGVLQDSGTSFSAPALAAQLARVAGWIITKTGKSFSVDENLNFMAKFNVDVASDKEQIYTVGDGMFVIPDLDSLNPSDWLSETKILRFTVGDKTFYENGIADSTDAAPEQMEATTRVVVPIRVIMETFGAKVDWDEATKTITIYYKDKTIVLQIGNTNMYVNGNLVVLDQAPFQESINERSMVPLRAISEALDAIVYWKEETKTVDIILGDLS